MKTYVVMLRGINVGGNKKVPMADLKAALADDGFENVTTYIQSGNIVLQCRDGTADIVEKRVARILKTTFGFDVAVIARTPKDLDNAITNNPFKEHEDEAAKLFVWYFESKPLAKQFKAIARDQFAPEEFKPAGWHMYVWCPDGAGRSKISTFNWAKQLDTPITVRNWNTVVKLSAMGKDLSS